MLNDDQNKLTIDEKLATVRFICNNKSHIVVDAALCKKCKDKNCVFFCPAGVYTTENDGQSPKIDFENCLECGTCRICCPMGAISWNYPEGGTGVRYRFG